MAERSSAPLQASPDYRGSHCRRFDGGRGRVIFDLSRDARLSLSSQTPGASAARSRSARHCTQAEEEFHLIAHFMANFVAFAQCVSTMIFQVLEKIGAPDRIRTCGLCLRRAALYPAELRVPERFYMRAFWRLQSGLTPESHFVGLARPTFGNKALGRETENHEKNDSHEEWSQVGRAFQQMIAQEAGGVHR